MWSRAGMLRSDAAKAAIAVDDDDTIWHLSHCYAGPVLPTQRNPLRATHGAPAAQALRADTPTPPPDRPHPALHTGTERRSGGAAANRNVFHPWADSARSSARPDADNPSPDPHPTAPGPVGYPPMAQP